MTYVDSRGLSPGRTGSGPSRTAGPSPTGNDSGPKAGLAEGDAWLNRIAMASRKHAIPVIQDDTPELFPGDYPINYAAQYYGWYSENVSGALAREDFRFVPGAVACHIHSFSATSLRDSHKGWVAPLLARGAAASMGAVFEPYLALTPNLDIFEQHLRDGFSFGESAYASMRVVSWMITVVGDPLYTPFKLLREDPPTKGAAEWEAYQKGAEIWVGQSRDAGAKQLAQSARKLRSGIIFEGLGLLETDAGNGPGALIAFQEARKNYKQQDDIVRVALHEVALLKGRKKEALGLIGKVIREHPTAHGVSLLRAAQTELVPTPTQTGGL